MAENSEKIKIDRYLLGELPDSECELVEEQFFADDQFFAEVEAAEMALIDRYVRNEMSAEERDALEQNYLVTPERKVKVADARSFHNELKHLRIPGVVEAKEKASWFERLFGGSGFSLSAMQLGTAAAVLILVVGVVWLLFDSNRLRQEVLVARNQQSETERELNEKLQQKERELQEKSQAQNRDSETVGTLEDEVARLRQEIDASRKKPSPGNVENPLQHTPLVATAFLIGARGGDIPTQIVLEKGTRVLNLRIPLNPSDGREFDVRITGNAGVVFEGSKLSPHAIQGGRILSVSIPIGKLPAGNYKVTIRNETAQERNRAFVIKLK